MQAIPIGVVNKNVGYRLRLHSTYIGTNNSNLLMTEMTHTRKHHCHAVLVGCGDNFCIAH